MKFVKPSTLSFGEGRGEAFQWDLFLSVACLGFAKQRWKSWGTC